MAKEGKRKGQGKAEKTFYLNENKLAVSEGKHNEMYIDNILTFT